MKLFVSQKFSSAEFHPEHFKPFEKGMLIFFLIPLTIKRR